MFIPARGKYDTDTFLKNVSNHLNAFECESNSCGYSILLNRTHLNAVQAIDLACRDVETPLQRLEHGLQSWIAYVVLPLFALANSGLTVKGIDISNAMLHPVTLGIMLGLVLGKPVGISLFAFLSVRVLGTPLPSGVNWRHIIGAGFLAGIGFTMSLFISGLSFAEPELLDVSKMGILAGSMVSALAGYVVLMLAVGSEDPSA
jgi:NhaA family Na+:H+ antiporter